MRSWSKVDRKDMTGCHEVADITLRFALDDSAEAAFNEKSNSKQVNPAAITEYLEIEIIVFIALMSFFLPLESSMKL